MAVPDPADQPISLQPVPALESRAEEPAVAEKLPVTAEKLPVFTPKLPIIRPGFPVNSACVTKCSQGQACIQSWPASCYCEDGIQRRCKAQCGVDPGPAKVCGGDLAAM